MSRRQKQLPVRFGLCLSEAHATKLKDVALIVHHSQAEVLRFLVDQMTLESLPAEWLTAIEAARTRQEGQA